jgi:hypothetical protein
MAFSLVTDSSLTCPAGHRYPIVRGIPVFLIAGSLYKDLVGNLRNYPIPEIRLPAENGERLLDKVF